MTAHQATIAFPISSPVNKQEARKLTTLRMAYVLSAASEAPSLVVTDPVTGDIPQAMVVLGRVYYFDSLDVSSVHDGTTILVSSDGKRYKLAANTDIVKYAVINVTTTAPPGSPSLGDAYLVAVGGTGAWSGHDGQVAIQTARGWEFGTLQVGQFIYDRSTDTYYHLNSSSVLTSGFGAQSLPNNSVTVGDIVGKPVRYIVENQTTNTPPTSASVGDAWVIGSSPTGAWTGNAGRIAICEVANSPATFTIYTPGDGWLVYDKNLKADFRYSSTSSSWVSAEGAIVNAATSGMVTSGGTVNTGGSGGLAYSATVAPTKTQQFTEDASAFISQYAARKTGARLRFTYQYHSGSTVAVVAALFRDAETTALDWVQASTVVNVANSAATLFFEIAANDASAHDYKVVFINTGGGAASSALTRRRMNVEEYV